MKNDLTKEEFLFYRSEGNTFAQIGILYGLTERQVNYRTKNWNLDYSKKKEVNHNFFSEKTKATYYWAGMLAADGWIEKSRDRVGLALQNQDIIHLEKFKKAIESSHDICPFMNNTANRIRFNSAKVVEDLSNIFNVTENKTFTFKMPCITENYLLLEFLRGYIDGDGHLEKTASGRVALSLCSANKSFLEEFKEICSLFINRPILQQVTLNINPKGQVYNIRLILSDSEDMLNLLYKNSTNSTRLNRKFTTASLVLR